MRLLVARTVTMWGFHDVRVGEASHPGPRRSQHDFTSDDEPLVRSNVGRHVVSRRQVRLREEVAVSGSQGCCIETLLDGLEKDLTVGDSEMSMTVPATPGALAAAGAVQEVRPTLEEGISVVNAHEDAIGDERNDVFDVGSCQS